MFYTLATLRESADAFPVETSCYFFFPRLIDMILVGGNYRLSSFAATMLLIVVRTLIKSHIVSRSPCTHKYRVKAVLYRIYVHRAMVQGGEGRGTGKLCERAYRQWVRFTSRQNELFNFGRPARARGQSRGGTLKTPEAR